MYKATCPALKTSLDSGKQSLLTAYSQVTDLSRSTRHTASAERHAWMPHDPNAVGSTPLQELACLMPSVKAVSTQQVIEAIKTNFAIPDRIQCLQGWQ